MRHRRIYRVAVCLAATLAACGTESPIDLDPEPGGDPDTYTVGGTLNGQDAAVTLSLNGSAEAFDGSSFTFAQAVSSGDAYSVVFVSSASGQACDVLNGIGVSTTDVDDVVVTCQAVQPELRFVDAEVTGLMGIGDLDGDGIEDIVITIRTLPGHPDGTNLDMYRILFGTGGAAYTTPLDVARSGSSDTTERGRHFVVDDFDGDGIDDFAYSSGQALEVFTVGPGRTADRIFAPGPNGTPLVGIDSDLNGSLDLVSIVFGGSNLNYLNLYRSNGDGTFATEEFLANRDDPEAQALGMGAPLNLVVEDFDADGVDDIAAVVQVGSGGSQSLAIAVFYGNGVGGFSYPAAVDPLSDDVFEGYFSFEIPSKELSAGDIDGDGDIDLVMTSTTDFILLLDNDGTGRFTESGRATVRMRPIHARLADFDGDGVLDLVTAHADSRDVTLAFGLGGGAFGTASGDESQWRTFALNGDAALYDMVVADLDGDGSLDVAIAEDGTNPPDSGRGSVQLWLAPGG